MPACVLRNHINLSEEHLQTCTSKAMGGGSLLDTTPVPCAAVDLGMEERHMRGIHH